MPNNTNIPALNICICTYNRAAYLKRCMDRLIPQLDPDKVLVTIIDNNSTDGTKSYVRQLEQTTSSIQYAHEPAQGLSHARNKAWRSSQSDWIFYVDDDCLPSKVFISAALNLIKSKDPFDAYGGPIDALFESDIPKWLPEGFGSFSMPYDSLTGINNGFIRGGCFMVKRNVLNALAGFDQRLGVTGNSLHYGEEIELQIRMRQAGYSIAYAPSLRTGHFVRVEKLNLIWVLHTEYARRRDKMLFAPVSFLAASMHLLKTSLGRLLWIPIHIGEVIFSRQYPVKKALYQMAQPMAYTLGEWVGVILSKIRK